MSTRFAIFPVIALVPICFAVIAGCGSGGTGAAGRNKVHPVEGSVTYKGQPVEGAIVLFHSVGSDIAASGLTDSQGKFRLQTYEANDGAVSGNHRVTVQKVELKTVPNPEDENLGPISSEEIWFTPRKYAIADTTPLSHTVNESGENVFQITLED